MSAANDSSKANFQLGEFHGFSGGGRRFVYTVPSAGIFELDDASAAVLRLLTEKPATQEELLAVADAETIGELYQSRIRFTTLLGEGCRRSKAIQNASLPDTAFPVADAW